MPFVSVTRLRIRSIRFLPRFFVHTLAAQRQVRTSPGFLGGSLLPDRRRAFWTLTVWDGVESMRGYMTTGAHRAAMPRLLDWCDEASVAHWKTNDAAVPSWHEAEAEMRRSGRPSKVRFPSEDHRAMTFAAPRSHRGSAITARPGD